MPDRDPLDDFDKDTFTANGSTRSVYRKGSGPGVVVISEVPGITPYVADFARKVVDEGMTVAMPDVIGVAGKPASNLYMAQSMAKACIASEFGTLKRRGPSPITDWLRALARDLHERCGGRGVGAIGMCLTGGFALSMAIDETIMAPALSQPSLPLAPLGNARNLPLTDDGLARIKDRVANEGLQVLGMRFTNDPLCPRARFERLEEEFGEGFIPIEVPSASRNPRGKPAPAHSVVTTDLIDEPGEPTHDALVRCLSFFREKLGA